MKTLDEVIELCEKALWCAYLPRDDTTTTAGLALYYLREYRAMKEHLACLDAVALHGENTQRVNNPALTWDELKQMEGKPVWVEINGYNGYWTIVHWNSNIVFEEYYDWIASPEDPMKAPLVSLDDTNFGMTWQAYRKERK